MTYVNCFYCKMSPLWFDMSSVCLSSVCDVCGLPCLGFVMSRVCYAQGLLCLGFVVSSVCFSNVCYVQCLLCLGSVMPRVCYVQGLLCLGFVVSRVCHVQGLSCLGFVVSRVCLSRVCLSRVGYGTLVCVFFKRVLMFIKYTCSTFVSVCNYNIQNIKNFNIIMKIILFISENIICVCKM